MARWKVGIMAETLRGIGSDIPKGTEVKYIRMLRQPDADGFRLTLYEWHYSGNNTYIRSHRRIIDGLPIIEEPIIK